MSLFHHDEPAPDPAADVLGGGADDHFDVADHDGNERRYSTDDFDEIYATADEEEMRHLLSIGWLLLDEVVATDPGERAPWLDTALRRVAGRVLPAGDDPSYEPPSDVPHYILGCLKPGHSGIPVP